MNKTKNEILKYIQNEKDIARYQISTLERGDISVAKRRILNMEKEFLTLPLEKINFEDVADVAAAISIYKTSRTLFYETYKINPPELDRINKNHFLDYLQSKLIFIKRVGLDYMTTKVQELNLVQNSDFYYDLAKRQSVKNGTSIEIERRELDVMDLDMLLSMEPLTLAKKRARAQAAIYSIGKYLFDSVNGIVIEESFSLEYLKEIEGKLDSIIKTLKNNVFKFYNDGLVDLPGKLNNTMGENSYLSKLHSLQNILDFPVLQRFGIFPNPISNPSGFSNQKPMIGNIFFGSKKTISKSSSKDAEKNIQNKVFGILLPIPRKGNEKMTLLYKDIKLDQFNISHLFTDNFSNIKALRGTKEIYFKAILMEPLWKIISMSITDNTSRHVLAKIANFSKDSFQSINFDNKNIINTLNNHHTGFFEVSNDSVVLTARTRSEEEGLAEIFPIINSKISEINDDYFRLSTTNEYFLE